ncbi:universal stress protein [Aeromicrobium sp. Leaf350]|uniref:universal stress protein n=1 Tax=Aeromicrobium sp. Leaf350 TaxID=2876565 RepID=UPI001E5C3500|nr:universal stress protein [Aeromicrobium sp. Leaf350]
MTVLVGFLPTAEGEAAFRAGIDEAKRRGESLTLVNSPRAGAPVTTSQADEASLAALVAAASEAGVELVVRQDPHEDDLAGTVLAIADEVDASVIVIGLRHRSVVGKLLMGSSAQRLLLDSTRPVLAVKP